MSYAGPMRTREDVARSTQAERAFVAALDREPNDAAPESPARRLANMVLVNAIKRGVSHTRVRVGDRNAIEDCHERRWEAVVTETPAGVLTRTLWHLKYMARIEPGTIAQCGATLRLALGKGRLVDFDVTFAHTPTGATIVFAVVPPAADLPPFDPRLLQRLDDAGRAGERGDREEVRRCLREVAEGASALERGDVRASQVRSSAGFVAHRAGLDELAVALLTAALDPPPSARDRAVAEGTLASALESLERLDEAMPHHERSLAAAEELAADTGLLVLRLSDAAGCAAHLGDVDRAERLLARALAVADVLLGPDHAFLAPRIELARVRRARDPLAAHAALLEVLSLAEAYGHDAAIEVALAELAEIELARGELAAATERVRRALALAGSHPRGLRLHLMLARALAGADRRSEALAILRAGADIARASRGPTHPERVAIEAELALAEKSSPYR